jgi:hypothetical protein
MNDVVKLALFVGVLFGCTVARADWVEKVETNADNLPQIAEWINGSCKPDSLDDIKVVSYQNGRGGDVSVHVFCNRSSGKLKPLVYSFWKYQRDIDLKSFVQNVLQGNQNTIVLLRDEGKENRVHYLH